MAIIEKNILLKALSYVIEPDLKRDIVSLGLVNEIKISEKNVSFSLAIKNNALHNKNKITTSINHFIKKFHNDPVDVTINFSVIETTAAPTENLNKVKHIIAITSGKGGVGKSTVSSNLAISLEKMGFKVGLVDADIYGPSIPSMFNVEEEKPRAVNEDNNSMHPIEAYGIKLMSIGFFGSLENAIVWRGPMAVKAIKQILYNTYWGELDYLLIDLPPGTGDIHLSLVQLLPLTGAVIVSTPQKIAIIDAIKAINMFNLPQINVPILGIIENMSYFTPKELPKNKYYIFGKEGGKKVAHDNNIALLGEIPIVQSIREASDSGRPAGMQEKTFLSETFKELAATLNAIISKKTKTDKSTPVPITHKKGCS